MTLTAAQTGDEYDELLAAGSRHASKEDWRRAAKACREAIALEPGDPTAYYNLGAVLSNSGHQVEAAQRYLEAKARYPVLSEPWAQATAQAFDKLRMEQCAEVAKPEWWGDEVLKVLSEMVLGASPNGAAAIAMRATVLSGLCDAWEAGPRSGAELKEAAALYERSAAMCLAPTQKALLAGKADWCRKWVRGHAGLYPELFD